MRRTDGGRRRGRNRRSAVSPQNNTEGRENNMFAVYVKKKKKMHTCTSEELSRFPEKNETQLKQKKYDPTVSRKKRLCVMIEAIKQPLTEVYSTHTGRQGGSTRGKLIQGPLYTFNFRREPSHGIWNQSDYL